MDTRRTAMGGGGGGGDVCANPGEHRGAQIGEGAAAACPTHPTAVRAAAYWLRQATLLPTLLRRRALRVACVYAPGRDSNALRNEEQQDQPEAEQGAHRQGYSC